jgi:adenylate cyclase
LVGAHLALGEAFFLLGDLSSARDHLEQCLALYVPQQHTTYTMLYGLDPGVFCLSWLPHVLWHLGYPDQALTRSHELLRLARTLAHPFSLAFALDYAAMFHQFRGDRETASQLADMAVRHCTEHGFALYLAWGKIIQGWVQVARGEQKDGIEQLRQGIADWQATGAALRLPYYFALLAEAQGNGGQEAEGLSLLDVALAQGNKTQEYHYAAELYRLKGELLLAQEIKNQKSKGKRQKSENPSPQLQTPHTRFEAETCFLKAIEIAKKQQAKSWELRAATSLARLWQQQSKRAEAHKLLSEVYNWFTEGFDTKELQDANKLLEDLGY